MSQQNDALDWLLAPADALQSNVDPRLEPPTVELFEGSFLSLLPKATSAHPRKKRIVRAEELPPIRADEPGPASLPKRPRRKQCECGTCRACRENARWDAIFNEKFADPAYYGIRTPGYSSPLA